MTSPFTFSLDLFGSFGSPRRTPKIKLSFFRLLEVLTIGLINLLLQAFNNTLQTPFDFRRIRLSFQPLPLLIRVGQHESTLSSSSLGAVYPPDFKSSSLGAVYPPDFKFSSKCSTLFYVGHVSTFASFHCSDVFSRTVFLPFPQESLNMAAVIAGITFDIDAADNGGIVSGYSKAARDALADNELAKVRAKASTCLLTTKLSKEVRVMNFNPSEMKDKTNFFAFVSSWEGVILEFENHFKSYHMMSPWTVTHIVATAAPTERELEQYHADLQLFLLRGAAVAGNAFDGQSFTPVEPAGGFEGVLVGCVDGIQQDRPEHPAGDREVQERSGNHLRDWHNLTFDQVLDLVKLQCKYVADATHRQNLVWTFNYIMDACDSDLREYVLSKIGHIEERFAGTGLIAFYVVASRLMSTTENLAQKVLQNFMNLRLTHFEGEDVVECIFTVRNVLRFLRYGEEGSYAPKTTLQIVLDIFRGSSVTAFRAFVQNLQDFQKVDDEMDAILTKIQDKYDELVLAGRWVATKKRGSVFVGESTRSYAEHDRQHQSSSGNNNRKNKNNNNNSNDSDKTREKPTHDRSGKKIIILLHVMANLILVRLTASLNIGVANAAVGVVILARTMMPGSLNGVRLARNVKKTRRNKTAMVMTTTSPTTTRLVPMFPTPRLFPLDELLFVLIPISIKALTLFEWSAGLFF